MDGFGEEIFLLLAASSHHNLNYKRSGSTHIGCPKMKNLVVWCMNLLGRWLRLSTHKLRNFILKNVDRGQSRNILAADSCPSCLSNQYVEKAISNTLHLFVLRKQMRAHANRTILQNAFHVYSCVCFCSRCIAENVSANGAIQADGRSIDDETTAMIVPMNRTSKDRLPFKMQWHIPLNLGYVT